MLMLVIIVKNRFFLGQSLSYEHTERKRQRLMRVNGDAWEWVRDPFWNVTMHFNGTLPLPLGVFIPLAKISYFCIARVHSHLALAITDITKN